MRWNNLHVLGVVLLATLCLLASPALRAAEADGEPPVGGDVIEMVIAQPLPLSDFLKAASRVIGVPFVWDPNEPGLRGLELTAAVNLRAPPAEFFVLVRALLASYDLVVVPVGPAGYQVYRVVDLKKAGAGLCMKPSVVELTEETVGFYALQDGLYVTATLPVEHLEDLEGALSLLQGMSTGHGLGHVDVVPEVRVFVVTDFAPVVVRMRAAILDLDARAGQRAEARRKAAHPAFDIVTLEHADAVDLMSILAKQFAANAGNAAGTLRIHADPRTNQLLVGGAQERVDPVLEVVKRLDVPVHEPAVWTHVVRLERSRVEEVEVSLRALCETPQDDRPSSMAGPVRIVAHGATNALLITATPEDFEQVKRIIDELDREP